MPISKRDLEIAALNWKVRGENTQRRAAELEHALNVLANDSVEWFHRTSDGAHHAFGIAVAFEVPIAGPISRVNKRSGHPESSADLLANNLTEGGNSMTVNSLKEFVALKKVVLEKGEDAQPNEELAKLIQSMAEACEEAHRSYLAKREPPVIH